MCENVQRIAETERSRKQKIVGIVHRMYTFVKKKHLGIMSQMKNHENNVIAERIMGKMVNVQ